MYIAAIKSLFTRVKPLEIHHKRLDIVLLLRDIESSLCLRLEWIFVRYCHLGMWRECCFISMIQLSALLLFPLIWGPNRILLVDRSHVRLYDVRHVVLSGRSPHSY